MGLGLLHYQFLALLHPLLIPVSMIELGLESAIDGSKFAHEALRHIERATGFSAQANVGQMLTDDGRLQKTMSYQSMARKLVELQSFYLVSEATLTAAKFALQSHLKHLKRLDTRLADEKWRKISLQMSDRLG